MLRSPVTPHCPTPATAVRPPQTRRDVWGARLLLLVILGADAVVIAALNGLGAQPLFRVDWSAASTWTASDPIPVLASGSRLMALAAAYWVAGAVIVHCAAIAHNRVRSTRTNRVPAHGPMAVPGPVTQVKRLAAAASPGGGALTLPWIRRLVERAMAPALAVSVLVSSTMASAPAFAQDLPPIPVVVETDHAAEGGDVPALDTTGHRGDEPLVSPAGATSAMVPPPPNLPAGAFAPSPASSEAASPEALRIDGPSPFRAPIPGTRDATLTSAGQVREAANRWYTVQPGDCFWTIASDHVRSVPGSTDITSVTRYWAALVEMNRDAIRSGDPDLIFPGEVIELPSVAP